IMANPLNIAGVKSTLSLTTDSILTIFNGVVKKASYSSFATGYIQNQTTRQSSSNFNISGNGTIGNNLNVTNTATFNGTVNLNSLLLVSGSTGTTGQVLTSNGISNAPSWQAAPSPTIIKTTVNINVGAI